MRVSVKLYGTFRRNVPDYRDEDGLSVDLPDGSTVGRLLDEFELTEKEGCVISSNGRIAKVDQVLEDGASIRIFPIAHGG